MAVACIGGIAYVKADARQFSVRGTLTISPNRMTRNGVAGMDGVHGFTAAYHVPYIEIEATNRLQFPMDEIERLDNVTITAELDSGETWVLRNAWHADDLELNAADGTLTVRFEGLSCERQ